MFSNNKNKKEKQKNKNYTTEFSSISIGNCWMMDFNSLILFKIFVSNSRWSILGLLSVFKQKSLLNMREQTQKRILDKTPAIPAIIQIMTSMWLLWSLYNINKLINNNIIDEMMKINQDTKRKSFVEQIIWWIILQQWISKWTQINFIGKRTFQEPFE